jgi:hypothetical protein
MTIRSIVLFSHICGMLLLFVALAYEWLLLASPARATGDELLATVQRVRPRLDGIGAGLLLVSGIYMARGGYFEFWWVRGSLALLLAMGALGGITRRASPSARRTSLVVRIALGLAAIYLMVAKPF